MGQSFKIISCLSSEFCRDYHCMLQGHHSVIRASQCTEHWVSAIQNIKIDPYALILAFKRKIFVIYKCREGEGDLAPRLRQQQVPGGHHQAGEDGAGPTGHPGS